MTGLVDSERQEARNNHECDDCKDGRRRPSFVSGRAGIRVPEERVHAQRQTDSEANGEQESCRASGAGSDGRVAFVCGQIVSLKVVGGSGRNVNYTMHLVKPGLHQTRTSIHSPRPISSMAARIAAVRSRIRGQAVDISTSIANSLLARSC